MASLTTKMAIPFLCLMLFLTHQAQASEALFEVSVNKFLMGTRVETTARHTDISACKQALYLAYQEMARIEDLLSYFKPESDIAKINQAAGIHPVSVTPETFAIIQRAKSYAEKFDALFDISIGPISTLWGFSDDHPVTVPAQTEITKRLQWIGYPNIVLDSLNTTVFLKTKGAKLDLGGIAKGYAIDRGVAILKENGIQHFLLNAGGDIYVSGQKDAQTDWRVGIKHPRNTETLLARFNLKDYAVATSGDYERFEIINGKRYHHILDPRTGYPGTQSQSTTALAQTAEEADVLATYLFLIGYQNALQNTKVHAPFLIVATDGSAHYNDAFAHLAGFEMLDRNQEP